MITLPSHTSHVQQPLNVSCFKPFKITFKKVKDVVMSRSNHMELNRKTLVKCVDPWALKQITHKKKEV
jgi:hypothetical protein